MAPSISLDVFRRAADPVLVVDSAGAIRLINQAAARMLGCPTAAAIGRRCWDIARMSRVDGRPFCGPRCPIRAAGASASPGRRHLVHTRSDGAPVDVQVFSVLIPTGHGRGCAVLHVLAPFDEARPVGDDVRAESAGVSPKIARGIARLGRLRPRELEVLRLLAAGHATATIADALSISPVTVRNHVRGILVTLGLHSRLEASLAWLCRHLAAAVN